MLEEEDDDVGDPIEQYSADEAEAEPQRKDAMSERINADFLHRNAAL